MVLHIGFNFQVGNLGFNTNSTVFPGQSKNKSKKIWEKHRILNDIERGRGGPDISGLKTMYRGYSSKLVEDAKRKLCR